MRVCACVGGRGVGAVLALTSSSERPSSATLRSVCRKAHTIESMMSLIWGAVIDSMHVKQCCRGGGGEGAGRSEGW